MSRIRIAVFQDQPATVVSAVLNRLELDLLQFHGHETAEFCGSFHKPYWKAVPMLDSTSYKRGAAGFAEAAALLLDTAAYNPAGQLRSGGTGNSFDWSLWPAQVDSSATPLVLAGGLHADNVAAAIGSMRPWAVDVSSGVEVSPGNKDAAKLQRFCSEVRSVRD